MITHDEIKDAMRGRIRVRYDGMVFSEIRSCRTMLKRKESVTEEWITSLELVKRRKRADGRGEYETVVWARVEECEVAS